MSSQSWSIRAAILLAMIFLGAVSTSAETILHRGNGGEPQTLDQAHTLNSSEECILKDLYEGLTIYDATGQIISGVAESWTLSSDALTYTFKLREDARWSDGSQVTAEDFVFSFQRIEDPGTAAGYASILYPIKNAERINGGEIPPSELGVKAINEKTLEITLERPTPFFLQLLAHMTALPISKASFEKNGADFVKPGVMVSNGAFKLASHVPNDQLIVEKNPSYWDAANVQLDRVIFYPIGGEAAAVRRFEAGEMDLVYNFSADQLDRLSRAYGDQVRVSSTVATYYYVFDGRQEPYNDVRVRRALSMVIDRDFLAREVYPGLTPTYSMVPPGLVSYGQPSKADFAELSQLDREDKAIELMNEAGYGKGGKPLDIEIRYNTSPNHERVAIAIADMWKNAFGASVSLVNLDQSSHYAYLQEDGAFNVARVSWVADYADAESFLALNLSTNETFNFGHYKNPEFDALMMKSYEEIDPAARSQLLHEAETLLMYDQPVAPVLTEADLWLVSERVQGWNDNVMNQHLSRFLSVSD